LDGSTIIAKESILFQRRQAALALQNEFAQWDCLSDEALSIRDRLGGLD
jgi:hypothetical protein